jgi:hypothetical protein
MIRFGRTILVSICLDLIEHRSSIFVKKLGIVVYYKTSYTSVEYQIAIFFHTVGHNVRNRLLCTNFSRSGKTVSWYFNKVFHTIEKLRNNFIRPPSSEAVVASKANTSLSHHSVQISYATKHCLSMIV